MGDPERLLKLQDGDELERELLSSIQDIAPPVHAKGEGWARLSAQIAAVALVTTAHGSAAASGATASPTALAAGEAGAKVAAPVALKALAAKVIVALGVAGAVIGAGAVWVHEHRAVTVAPVASAAPPPVAAAAAKPVSPPSAPEPAPSEPTLSDEAAATVTPEPVAVKRSAEQHRRDQLGRESSLLTQARAELRQGDARAAAQTLARLQTEFPHGVLGQEREVLAIEVLAARGNTAAAKRRAQAFIAAYPKSPHSATLARFADTP